MEFSRRSFLKGISLTAFAVAAAQSFAIVDVDAYQITPSPTAVRVTFANGARSRGFSWQTDTSVTESEVRLVAGAATPADFAAERILSRSSSVMLWLSCFAPGASML